VSEHSTAGGHEAHVADAHSGDHDSAASHPRHEQPSDWGWNGEFGPWASRAGWAVVVIIGLLFLGVTHYNGAGFLAQLLVMAGLVAALLWDRNRKRTSWRD
jgi:hypothetical protein